jgi:hypothetical protein
MIIKKPDSGLKSINISLSITPGLSPELFNLVKNRANATDVSISVISETL